MPTPGQTPDADPPTTLAGRIAELEALRKQGVLSDDDMAEAVALAKARYGAASPPMRSRTPWLVVGFVVAVAGIASGIYFAVTSGGSSSASADASTTTRSGAPTKRVPALRQFTGVDFSIGYPATFYVETNEVDKGSYEDTTLRKPGTDDTLVRVNFSAGDMSSGMDSAYQLEGSLTGSSGYRRIGITPTTLAGMPAARWEFLTTTDSGRTLRTVNILGHNAAGGWGVLTRAPETGYAKWAPVFKRVRASFEPRG